MASRPASRALMRGLSVRSVPSSTTFLPGAGCLIEAEKNEARQRRGLAERSVDQRITAASPDIDIDIGDGFGARRKLGKTLDESTMSPRQSREPVAVRVPPARDDACDRQLPCKIEKTQDTSGM